MLGLIRDNLNAGIPATGEARSPTAVLVCADRLPDPKIKLADARKKNTPIVKYRHTANCGTFDHPSSSIRPHAACNMFGRAPQQQRGFI
jgi:hypothetical protein